MDEHGWGKSLKARQAGWTVPSISDSAVKYERMLEFQHFGGCVLAEMWQVIECTKVGQVRRRMSRNKGNQFGETAGKVGEGVVAIGGDK